MLGLTGEQVRAGRALLGWEQAELAERANISVKTVKRLEATNGQVDARSEWAVKKALELAGIELIGEHDWRERTDGVRFAKDKTARLREELVEDVSRSLLIDLKIACDDDPDFFERPPNDVAAFVTEKLRDSVKEKVGHLLNKPK
ncbi:helix-turn-helix transcriptional regulator [Bradyrhizobium sp. Cp5.3]|uniref:helix-turn-helix domain-containing protein n=1 Tax=Bradyrhizobium sp. Cp5.3 TaxID=443598 RepID=UPI0006865702|nr:helix-turn-helix transcriptional regulator [Bradyrhizobium sp. Cp5.3]